MARPASRTLPCPGEFRDEPATGTVPLSLRINRQTVECRHMIVRRDHDRLTELRVPDDYRVNLGDEHIVRARALREE